LFAFNVLETPFILKTIWLAQEAGMSQELIGVYQALELVIAFVSLMVLEWWRQRTSARRVLLTVIAAVFVLYPLWLFIPGVWSKFLLMPPLGLFFFMFWPLLRGSSLASVPGKAGVVTAVTALFGLAPLPLLFGLLADAIGLTPAMFGVHLLALPVLALLALQTQ
jgi:fucose permease